MCRDMHAHKRYPGVGKLKPALDFPQVNGIYLKNVVSNCWVDNWLTLCSDSVPEDGKAGLEPAEVSLQCSGFLSCYCCK